MDADLIDFALPPHSSESEQALIGGLLLNNHAHEQIAGLVAEADFYDGAHRAVFAAIQSLIGGNRPADIVTVAERLISTGQLDAVGGLGYLASLAQHAPSSANVRAYASIVRDKAIRRQMIARAEEIRASAYTGDTVAEILPLAQQSMLDLQADAGPGDGPVMMRDLARQLVEDIDARAASNGAIAGVSTGFADLDQRIDGLIPGNLIVIAGRPSMGKTTLAQNIGENVALAGHGVYLVSLEMGDLQTARKTVASIGGIDSKRLKRGDLQDEDWQRLTLAASKLADMPLAFDRRARRVAQIAARARRLKKQIGLKLVIVDYLQLLDGEGENQNIRIATLSRELKKLAVDLDVTVIVLSQLSRECEKRPNKRPMLSDLRDSGAIEQDADVVVLMYRDDYYDPASAYRGLAEANVAKNRDGEVGTEYLAFQGALSRFKPADQGAVYAAMNAQDAPPKRVIRNGSDGL